MNLRIITLLAALVALSSAPLHAQGLDAQTYHPLPNQALNYGSVASGELPAHLQWQAGGSLTYAHGVLSQRDESGDIVHRPIASMLTLNVLGTIGLWDRLEIGLDIPVHLLTSGDEAPAGTQFLEVDSGAGIGDIRLLPRALIFATDESASVGFRLAGQVGLVLPTGDPDRFHSEGFKLEPRVIAELTTNSPLSVALNLGYIMRSQAYFPASDLEVDDAISWGLGLGVRASESVRFVADVHGEFGYASVTEGAEKNPVEALVAAQFDREPLALQVGFGRGLTKGFGTANFRFVVGASWGRSTNLDRDGDQILNRDDACPDDAEDLDGFEDEDGCPDDDNDNDGVLDRRDRCRNVAEDIDGFEDEDGCPDEDNDGDGVLDADDACPDVAEDIDLFEDEDGCPEEDNDGDGVLDADDRCVNSPEDIDGFEDEDGCADPDNDGDRIMDGDDLCPLEAETYNGVDDEDGCPEEGSLILLTQRRGGLTIPEPVTWFDGITSNLTPQGNEVLRALAVALQAYPQIELEVWVSTRDRADEPARLAVSSRRATAIRNALVNAGVSPERITTDPTAAEAGSQGRNYEVELLLSGW